MLEIKFSISSTEEAERAAAIMSVVAAEFGSPPDSCASDAGAEPKVRRTRRSREQAPASPTADPVALYQQLGGNVSADETKPAATPVVVAENTTVAVPEAVLPGEAATASATAPVSEAAATSSLVITLDTIRPLMRDKGVLWGRDALTRYNVKGFSQLNQSQIEAIYAELSPQTVTAVSA